MKQRLKFILLLLFAGSMFLLQSCEKDLYDEPIYQQKSKAKVELFTLEEVFKKQEFLRSYNRIPKKKISRTNSLGKSIIEETYGFTIIDAPVKLVELNGEKTYTLLIVKDDNTDQKLENLVLYDEPKEGEIGCIIKYDCIKDTYLTEEEIKYSGVKEIEGLSDTGTSTVKILYIITHIPHCINSYGGIHYCGGNPNNPYYIAGQCGHYEESFFFFEDSGGGGGGEGSSYGGTSGSGTSGGGSTSGSTNGNTGGGGVITSPIGGGSVTAPNPCGSLKKLTDPTKPYNIAPKLTYLHNSFSSNTNNGEDGVSFQIGNNNVPNNVILPSTPDNTIDIPTGPNIYGAAHTHPNSLEPIFSFSDLINLYNLYDDCDSQYLEDVVFMLVNEDGTVYAIKVDNINGLYGLLVEWLQDPKYSNIENLKYKIKRINLDFMDQLKKKSGVDNNLERGFLEMVNGYGVSLYKSSDANHTQWNKLDIPDFPNQAGVKPTNCN